MVGGKIHVHIYFPQNVYMYMMEMKTHSYSEISSICKKSLKLYLRSLERNIFSIIRLTV